MLYDQLSYLKNIQTYVKLFDTVKILIHTPSACQTLITPSACLAGILTPDRSGKPKQKLASTRSSCNLLDAVLVNVKVNYM